MAAAGALPGQVIHYSYLWLHEHRRGREEGVKDRPCVVVISVRRGANGKERVIVVPVTHTPPSDPTNAVEIPHRTKVRLGLDDLPSWIIINEGNQFVWPGPDVRPLGQSGKEPFSYGLLPADLFQEVRVRFVEKMKKTPRIIPRTD